MRPEALKFLFDIHTACEQIEAFTGGKSYEDYLASALPQSAVERQLMIAGEALFQALKVDPTLEGVITDARRIINFRHVLVHEYGIVQPATVWGSVQRRLPTLRREVDALLAEAPAK